MLTTFCNFLKNIFIINIDQRTKFERDWTYLNLGNKFIMIKLSMKVNLKIKKGMEKVRFFQNRKIYNTMGNLKMGCKMVKEFTSDQMEKFI